MNSENNQTKESPDMTDDGFDMLSTPPTNPDLGKELKSGKGAGLPKSTMGLIGVVLLGGSFVGGIAVGKSGSPSTPTGGKSATSASTPGAARGTRGPGGARGGGVTGTISMISGDTLQITDTTGKVTTVTTTGTTTVTIAKSSALTDLTTGMQVTVIGATGTDGTVTARSVVSGLTGGFGGGFGGGRPTSAPTG